MKSKYIIIKDNGLEMPVVFNPLIDHSTIAGANKVVSAGFCRCNIDGYHSVWGESVKLRIKSRPEDADILDKMLEYEL